MRVCAEPGCPELVQVGNRCPAHARPAWQPKRMVPRLRGRQKTERNRRILRRYRTICHVCGNPGADQVDHVIALAFGGSDDDTNLRPIHQHPCHNKKTAREAAEAKQRVG